MHKIIAVLFIVFFSFSVTYAEVSKPDTKNALEYLVLRTEKEEMGGLIFYDCDIQLSIPPEAYTTLTDDQVRDSAIAAVWDIYTRTKYNAITVKIYYDKYCSSEDSLGYAELNSGSKYRPVGWNYEVYPVPSLLEMQIHTLWYDLKPKYMVQGCYGMEVDRQPLVEAIAAKLQVPVELVEIPSGERGLCRDLH